MSIDFSNSSFSNKDDFVQVDDIRDRIVELRINLRMDDLEYNKQELEIAENGGDEDDKEIFRQCISDIEVEQDEDELEEIQILESVLSECEDYRIDSLIHEDKFTDYAEELAYDVGMIERNSSMTCYIDWERWASDLKHDYMPIDFDGQTYYGRAD